MWLMAGMKGHCRVHHHHPGFLHTPKLLLENGCIWEYTGWSIIEQSSVKWTEKWRELQGWVHSLVVPIHRIKLRLEHPPKTLSHFMSLRQSWAFKTTPAPFYLRRRPVWLHEEVRRTDRSREKLKLVRSTRRKWMLIRVEYCYKRCLLRPQIHSAHKRMKILWS